MADRPNFLFLEPFYGGSHRDFADGLVAHSRHAIELVTLPDRFWKWRMRGASIYLARRIENPGRFDGLLLSGLMNLADLKALWGRNCPPALVYFHENQLTYPSQDEGPPDYQPGFTNLITALTAKRNLFNSRMQMDGFLTACTKLIRTMPDCRPKWAVEAIKRKSAVAYPGIHIPADARPNPWPAEKPPLVIWNHRWEHDKNPEAFFTALERMAARGIDFEVAVLGESFPKQPAIFEQARQTLGRRIVQFGHVPSRQMYYQWLASGTVVISTARQENFGIAVVEAIRSGCLPLLPHRLSYPEIVPQPLQHDFLYADQDDLEDKLARVLTHAHRFQRQRLELAQHMTRFAWENVIARFDAALDQLPHCADVSIDSP